MVAEALTLVALHPQTMTPFLSWRKKIVYLPGCSMLQCAGLAAVFSVDRGIHLLFTSPVVSPGNWNLRRYHLANRNYSSWVTVTIATPWVNAGTDTLLPGITSISSLGIDTASSPFFLCLSSTRNELSMHVVNLWTCTCHNSSKLSWVVLSLLLVANFSTFLQRMTLFEVWISP